MRYLTVCSGIGAPEYGWRNLPWQCVGQSEIEPFPSAVLAHRFPGGKNHGDFTRIQPDDVGPVDLIIGGTPCQSFSIAGKRLGLDDPRGNLALEYLALARRLQARWLIWENVPGVLSSDGGRDFGAFLGLLGECGYGFAYRVLDAQHFGVPQRRRRVFVVGYLGDWRRAAAVLFEPEGVHRNHAAGEGSRETGRVAGALAARTRSGGGFGTDFDLDGGLTVAALTKSPYADNASRESNLIAATLTANMADKQGLDNQHIDAGAPNFIVGAIPSSLGKGLGHNKDEFIVPALSPALNCRKGGNRQPDTEAYASTPDVVRRLTVTECARLQGFPDDWARIPWRGAQPADCPDGPQYKAYGNSMATPVLTWIGERIQAVEETASDPAKLRDSDRSVKSP